MDTPRSRAAACGPAPKAPPHRAPEWLPATGPGDSVTHLDLHPENVLLHGTGALVIDWANARAGHWADDVAQTLVILAGADLDRWTKLALRAFLWVYLAGFDRAAVRTHLAAIDRRMADPNMTARERELIPLVRVCPSQGENPLQPPCPSQGENPLQPPWNPARSDLL